MKEELDTYIKLFQYSIEENEDTPSGAASGASSGAASGASSGASSGVFRIEVSIETRILWRISQGLVVAWVAYHLWQTSENRILAYRIKWLAL